MSRHCDAYNKVLNSFHVVAQVIPNECTDADDDDNLTADNYVMMMTLAEGLMSDDELMCFFALDTLCAAESESEHKKYARFSLNPFGTAEFRKYFRFEKKDIDTLYKCLAIPEHMHSKSCVTWSGLEGLCILLWRLAYPNLLCNLVPLFGRSKTEMSEIVNEMLSFLCAAHKHRLNTITQPWLDHAVFCQVTLPKGATLANIFGFIDGTTVCICRPSTGQEEVFSGHKHYHVLKFQHVMTPNGIIAHSFGPFAGRCNDAAMYRDSGLDAELQRTHLNGQQLALFGDRGYANRPWLQTPLCGQIGNEQRAFNAMMSSVRISVEWGFAKVKMLFAFTNFYCNQKLFLQPLANYFTAATLLANCHTCLYGSEISNYFGVKPLTLDEYLA